MFARVNCSLGRIRCRRVHSGLRGFTRALYCVVGFNRARVSSHGCARCINSGSSWFTTAHTGFVAFIQDCVGSLGRSSGSFRFAWVNSGPPRGCRVHSSFCTIIRARLVVVGFIQVRVGSL